MNNFDLHTPTRILFGKGAIEKLREQIPAEARVLITYGGGSVKKTGVLDQVLTALNGLDVLEFGGIEPNPSYETLMNAVKLAREEKVTFLLALRAEFLFFKQRFKRFNQFFLFCRTSHKSPRLWW